MNMKQIQQMMKQAQAMQGDLEKAKSEIDAKEFQESVGGGVVVVTMLGSKEIVSIDIKEEILEPDEKEMLQDLIKMAINNINEKIDAETEKAMGPLAGGLPF